MRTHSLNQRGLIFVPTFQTLQNQLNQLIDVGQFRFMRCQPTIYIELKIKIMTIQ